MHTTGVWELRTWNNNMNRQNEKDLDLIEGETISPKN